MKKKILILDDKETIAKVLSIYLMSDYDVQWLPDGLQAVKWLQAGNTPDLIISDIRMPGMRGDDFLEWIKQPHPSHYAQQRGQHQRAHPTVGDWCSGLHREAFQSNGVENQGKENTTLTLFSYLYIIIYI